MSSSPTGSAELITPVIEQTGVREITYMIFRWLDILVNDLHLICSVISVVHIKHWVFILMSLAAETARSRSSRSQGGGDGSGGSSSSFK